MATSTLTFYQTSITPKLNCSVDNITAYLESLDKWTLSNYQYIKLALDLTIKINVPQYNVPKFNYNYVAIKNSDVTKTYYYFIIGTPEWISSDCVKLSLSLDTINTFKDDLVWTDKTIITRQHKDRFITNTSVSGNNITLLRSVDAYDEGISPVKYFKSEESLTTSLNYDFYLIYKNKANMDVTTSVPLDCFLCASQSIDLNITVDYTGIQFSDYNVGDSLYVFAKDNSVFTTTINGTSYTIGGSSEYKGIAFVKRSVNNVAYILRESDAVLTGPIGDSALTDVTATLNVRVCRGFDPGTDTSIYNYYYILGEVESKNYTSITIGQSTAKLLTINDVNRSDTSIVKIIKMPYPPFTPQVRQGKMSIPDGWTFSGGFLLLNDLNTEFLSYVDQNNIADLMQVTVAKLNIATDQPYDIKYESKLYNSSFYTLKYMYDNFEKEFLLERYHTSILNPGIDIKFKQSNNISSNSLFDLTAYNGSYDEPLVYGQYLNVNRSNEVALYSSDYINYIRTGYNYDKKAKELQFQSSLTSTGLSTIGSIFSAAFGGGIGQAAAISAGTSVFKSIVDTINSQIQAENNIQQKLDQTRLSPTSVSSTEDLNLLSYYNGNRLLKVQESIQDRIKNSIYNLFRLTGYACNDYGIPQTDTRLYYNFIQCDPQFDESKWNYSQSFLDDIKAKYNVGVTVFHRVNNAYDFLQTMENFEKWLITTN